MLDTVQGMSLLTMMEIVGPILLAAVLIYGIYPHADAAISSRSPPKARSIHKTATASWCASTSRVSPLGNERPVRNVAIEPIAIAVIVAWAHRTADET